MKILRIFFPGDFEDAYVYMGWLNIIRSDRALNSINLSHTADMIDASNKNSFSIATHAFARNDWLVSMNFRHLMRNADIKQAFLRAADAFPTNYEVTQKPSDHFVVQMLPIKSSLVLDILFYNRRLYVGANDGLEHVDVNWDYMEVANSADKRHDARCFSLSAKYGMINSSCGSDGLLSCFDDFYLSDFEPNERGFRKVADKSVRTSWIDSDIANYSSNTSVGLYHTDREKLGSGPIKLLAAGVVG